MATNFFTLKVKMADINNQNDLCQLCFRCKYTKLDSHNHNDVLEKIQKYLLIKMEYSSPGICLNCYNSIEDFHNFYEQVHAAQKNFNSIKTTTDPTESDKIDIEKTILGIENQEDSDTSKIFPKAKSRKCKNEDSTYETDDLDNNSCDTSSLNKPKKTKSTKSRQISSEMEKKMVEFYNIKCEKCENVKFTSFKMLNKHYSTVHNTQGYIKCCKRNIRVNDKSYLRSHMVKHLQPESCRCGICGKELSSLVTLKHHMILHKPTEERPFQCSECDKRFCCKNDLKNHEKAIHLPEHKREDFICDVCGKVFQKVANLRYHHSTVHLQERKYICEICAKCFTTQSGLRTHMNAAHSTKGPIQCQECNKWLKNEDTFQKHLQLHQNNSYPCTHCDKVCNSSTSLRSHMVKHSEERPFSCHVCRKSFKTKTHLKNHSFQHSGGSNYKCPYCTKTFVNMSNYYTHRKRMHSMEKDNQRNDNDNGKVMMIREEVYPNVQTMQVEEQGSPFIYDYKIMKNCLETPGSGAIEGDLGIRPNVRQNIIIPPINLKYS